MVYPIEVFFIFMKSCQNKSLRNNNLMEFQKNISQTNSVMTDFKIVMITIIGASISQLIATIQIYWENIRLSNQVTLIKASGYLTVPDTHMLSELDSIQTAFCSGFFFTGTIGLGITAICYLTAWFWVNQSKKNKYILGLILIQWAYALYQANSNGYSHFTAYLILLAPSVFWICVVIPSGTHRTTKKMIFFWMFPVLFLLLSILGMDRSISFISIRDYWLLSNRLGNAVNNFYYQYTLYPGEMIKPLSLRQQKTCFLVSQITESEQGGFQQTINIIKQKCIDNDYFVISDQTKADLILQISNHRLLFQHHRKIILEASIKNFFKESDSLFSTFSEKTDVNDFFRKCIFMSLIFGSPILLYSVLMILFLSLLNIIYKYHMNEYIVIIVVCTGILLLIKTIPAHINNQMTSEIWFQSFEKSYSQNNCYQGVALLKYNCIHQINITQKGCQVISNWLTKTNNSALKYWMIRNLSNCHQPGTQSLLYKMIEDPQVNVVCQSLYALGRQGDKRAIPRIMRKLETSNHWYIQMYAYRALKKLGWRNIINNN